MNNIKTILIIAFVAITVGLFVSGCAATCVTCNTCPNTVGMAGYN